MHNPTPYYSAWPTSPHTSYLPIPADIFLAFSAAIWSRGFCSSCAASRGRWLHAPFALLMSGTGRWKPGCWCRRRWSMVWANELLRCEDFGRRMFSLFWRISGHGPGWPFGWRSVIEHFDHAAEATLWMFLLLLLALSSPSLNLNWSFFWSSRKMRFWHSNCESNLNLFLFSPWCWRSVGLSFGHCQSMLISEV